MKPKSEIEKIIERKRAIERRKQKDFLEEVRARRMKREQKIRDQSMKKFVLISNILEKLPNFERERILKALLALHSEDSY